MNPIQIKKTEGFIKLIENKNIKSSYALSEPQVLSILELKLQKLTALGINEIELEINSENELLKLPLINCIGKFR